MLHIGLVVLGKFLTQTIKMMLEIASLYLIIPTAEKENMNS